MRQKKAKRMKMEIEKAHTHTHTNNFDAISPPIFPIVSVRGINFRIFNTIKMHLHKLFQIRYAPLPVDLNNSSTFERWAILMFSVLFV